VNWQRWEKYAHLIASAFPCECMEHELGYGLSGKVRFLRVQKKEPEEKIRNETEFKDKYPGK
jgi:hypothetical protein